jgi:hypothetical protein
MKQQQQHLFVTLCALVAFLSCSMLSTQATATSTNNKTPSEKRRHLRSLLLRGGANRPDEEKSHGDTHQDRDLKSLSISKYATGEFASTLDLYQMDTSMLSPNTATDAVQPLLDAVVSNGASGQLFYKESGWDFAYALTARGLPSDTAYELLLMIPMQMMMVAVLSP